MEKDPFKAYEIKLVKFERGYLTEFELEELEQKEFVKIIRNKYLKIMQVSK